MCVCVCVCVCEYIHIYIYICTCVYIFLLPYRSYDIRSDLLNKPSIIKLFSKYFLPDLGPSSWVYFKTNVTFTSTLLLCKN